MSKKCKGPTEDQLEDEVFTGNASVKGFRKMKLFSRHKAILNLPGFRKQRKLFHHGDEVTSASLLDDYDPRDIRNRPAPILSSLLEGNVCKGDNSSVLGSVSSSVSSLDDQFVNDKRTTSVDSGIDCLNPSSSSLTDMSKRGADSVSLPVGPTLVRPDSLLNSSVGGSYSSVLCGVSDLPSIDEISLCDLSANSDLDVSGISQGRAPIASPEDDSLLEDPDSDSDANSILVSPEKSRLCKYDSDSDSDIQSPGKAPHRHRHGPRDDSFSDTPSCSCDSDSDSDECIHRRRRRRHLYSDSDSSDSEDFADSIYVSKTKCYNKSSSLSKKSSKSVVNSKQGSKSVHKKSVNRKQQSVKSSRVKSGSRMETTFGASPDKSPTIVLEDTPHNLLNPQPKYGQQGKQNNCVDSVKTKSTPNLSVNDKSAFSSYNSTGSMKISYVDNSKVWNLAGKKDTGTKNKKKTKLRRSVSDCARKSTLPSSLTRPCDSVKVSDAVIDKTSCESPIDKDSVTNLPFNLDTSKSLQDVQRAMKKTAFWIENNAYDNTMDPSTNSLLKDKKPVSETDLCNEILGIYFGEDDDSDSSLSSSCLENSFDSSSSSFISDENLNPHDSFSLATYVPAPAVTAKAKTRHIHAQKEAITAEIAQKKAELKKLKHKQSILQEKIENSEDDKKPVPEKRVLQRQKGGILPMDNKPPSLLSEHEVDTITKLHTMCNGQRVVKYLNLSESNMVISHFPPPKNASRISWCDNIANADLVHHTPTRTPVRVKPILSERPKTFTFPYDEDRPSPIIITRVRRSKSLSRKKEWPW